MADDARVSLERELVGPPPPTRVCQGTLISRAQYLVAIECWGYEDAALWTAAIADDAAAADAAPAAATTPTATTTPRAS